MKKIKLSIAALALVLTAGLTATSVAANKAPNDCSLSPTATTGNLDSSKCKAPFTDLCCYLVSNHTQINGVYTP